VEINLALHNVILEYARNEKLTGMLGLFRNMVMHHRHVTAYMDERREQMCKEHEDIVNALEQQDAALAEKEMRLHVQNAYHYYVSCKDNC
jgi:DNA-binding GntR family transcriptional regulator